MATNNCRTCKWAKRAMTAHKVPRINTNLVGTCVYPLSRIAVPKSLRLGASYVHRDLERSVDGWSTIAPKSPEENCRVWEKSAVSRPETGEAEP